MKLWLLRRKRENGYDVHNGFVIRAESEDHARVVAGRAAGDEGELAWLRRSRSTCEELLADGNPCIVLADFNAG
jgi:hypothetical protein